MAKRRMDVEEFRDKYELPGTSVNSLVAKLSDRNRIAINYFWHVLADYWRKNRKDKSPCNGIYVTKVIMELVRRHPAELDFVTRAWYLYGLDAAKPIFLQDKTTPPITEVGMQIGVPTQTIETWHDEILDIAREYDPNAFAFAWEEKHYLSFSNDVYYNKLQVQKKLNSKSPNELCDVLSDWRLSLITSSTGNKKGRDLLLRFIDITMQAIVSNNAVPDSRQLCKTFDISWRYYALINLTLTAMGDNREELQSHFSPADEISYLKAAEQAINELGDAIRFDTEISINSNQVQKEILKRYHFEP